MLQDELHSSYDERRVDVDNTTSPTNRPQQADDGINETIDFFYDLTAKRVDNPHR